MVGWHHRFNGHEPGQLREMERDREAWQAAVLRSQGVEQDLATEQQCA